METERSDDFPYLRNGILAGVLGAFVVALFFFVLDVAAGRPLATPTALGAVLFRGEPFDLSRPPDAVLILAYTVMHGTVFIGFAAIAADVLLGAEHRSNSPWQRVAALTAALFLASTVIVYAFSGLWSISGLPAWQVLTANLLAAFAMAVPLARLHPRGENAHGARALVGADGLEPPTPSV